MKPPPPATSTFLGADIEERVTSLVCDAN
jgi:hypothetical protein